jgi:hypothetical protein
MKPPLCLLALLAVLLAGCVVHHYGDARLREKSDALGITADRLSLKPVPLDQVGTHTLHARNLPFPIYPTHLRIPLTPAESELKGNLPWQKARLRIEMRTTDGQPFFSKEVSLADAERGRSPGTYHELNVQFRQPDRRSWRAPENMPHHTDYDVVVTVLQASAHPNRATLYADTYVR